ncbi:hypothetical protein BANRA_03218 [Klebsiella quasipneumoniae]|nr:hypothetical protein BANRA_03218 [Klebsiella quasipneumoniae]
MNQKYKKNGDGKLSCYVKGMSFNYSVIKIDNVKIDALPFPPKKKCKLKKTSPLIPLNKIEDISSNMLKILCFYNS